MSRSLFPVQAALLSTVMAGSLLGTASASGQQLMAVNDGARLPAATVASDNAERSAKPDGSRARAFAVWTGELKGGGRVTFTVDRIGRPESLSDPEWPVQTHWTINVPKVERSFSAELFGWMRDDGSMRLAGIVTDGYKKGAEVHIDRHGGNSAPQVRIYPLRSTQ
jgi:hypothetical protein